MKSIRMSVLLAVLVAVVVVLTSATVETRADDGRVGYQWVTALDWR